MANYSTETGNHLSDAEGILRDARTIVVVDWPSKDVPMTLASSGYQVLVKGGPEPDDYSAYALRDGEVEVRQIGRAPGQADLVYSHRPLDELSTIVAMARQVGASAVWCQSGLASDATKDPKGCWVSRDESQQARAMAESAGLLYVDDVYIFDVARQLATVRRPSS